MLTIVIPFWNGNRTLGRLLTSLPSDIPVIIAVDEGSSDPKLGDFDAEVIHCTERGYFAGTVNTGIRAAYATSDILILNQDAYFNNLDFFKEIPYKVPIYALFGEGVFEHPAWPNGYVVGTCMYMRRDAIDTIGLFDVQHWPHWGTTCEWQLRACRAGYKAHPMEVPGFEHTLRGRKFGLATRLTLKDDPTLREELIRTPPELSVIVPCYNYGRYLEDCIHSLIGGKTSLPGVTGQTYSAFEIIIVDDASTDKDTRTLVESLNNPWKGIRSILNPENRGTPYTNNVGIEAAHGKYILMQAADDMRENTSVERMLDLQKANPESFIYDDIAKFSKGRITENWRMPDYDFDRLIQKNFIHSAIMFPENAWRKAGKYNEIMTMGREDWQFNVALGVIGCCGIHDEHFGCLYRREGQGRSLTNTNPSWAAVFGTQMYSLYKDIYKGERPMGCCGKGRNRMAKLMKNNPVNASVPIKRALIGKDGMVLIEYIGLKSGKVQYLGPSTGTMYQFNRITKKQGWVDQSDLVTKNPRKRGLLEISEGLKPAFKLVRIKPVPEQTTTLLPRGLTKEPEEEPVAEVSVVEVAPPETKVKKARKSKTKNVDS